MFYSIDNKNISTVEIQNITINTMVTVHIFHFKSIAKKTQITGISRKKISRISILFAFFFNSEVNKKNDIAVF